MATQTHEPLPQANASFLEDLQAFLANEDALRFADMFTGFVTSGGIHGTVAGLVGTPSALLAYPGGYYTTETASITYPDATSFVWVIAHSDTVGNVGTFTRVPGTHYLIESNAAQPVLPAGCVYLMRVTTAGGAITAVVDLRTLAPVTSATSATLALTNRTGGALVAGDVVALSNTDEESVILSDVTASLAEFVVALQPVANLAVGIFARGGRVGALSAAAAGVGTYLRKSAISKTAEPTGASAGPLVVRPAGTFAIALSPVSGGLCKALLLGLTETFVAYGQCRLIKNGADLQLIPWDGNRLTISRSHELVPPTGLILGPGGLAASTTYYIYAAATTPGIITLEASTTAPALSGGIKVKTGDTTRTLVGMARTNAGTAWADSDTQRFVLSWFNQRIKRGIATFTANRTTASVTYVELHTEIRVEFLTWAETRVRQRVAGGHSNTGTNSLVTSCQFDAGTGGEDGANFSGTAVANAATPVAAESVRTNLSEGYHFATVLGSVGAGTGTWVGLGTAAGRVTSIVEVNG